MNKKDQNKKISQVKTNAIAASFLYQKQIKKLNSLNKNLDFFTLSIPIMYLSIRYIIINSNYSLIIANIVDLMSAMLIVFSILRLINKWSDNVVEYSIMSSKNELISIEASELLRSKKINETTFIVFLKRVGDIDERDKLNLANIKLSEKQEAYREVLKIYKPGGSVNCKKCNADPNKFRAGNCQVCGGTPILNI